MSSASSSLVLSHLLQPQSLGDLCMPTQVAVSPLSGLVFVGNGYCDSLVNVYYAANGSFAFRIARPVDKSGEWWTAT